MHRVLEIPAKVHVLSNFLKCKVIIPLSNWRGGFFLYFLKSGLITIGNTKCWIDLISSGVKEVSFSDHTHSGYAISGHTHSGYASSSHTHAASGITSGTISVARGGTGVTSLDALKTALGISSSITIKTGKFTCPSTISSGASKSVTVGFSPTALLINYQCMYSTGNYNTGTNLVINGTTLNTTKSTVSITSTGFTVTALEANPSSGFYCKSGTITYIAFS